MSDDRTEDPREFRGGVREPENAKGNADTEGIVPREMTDDDGLPPQDNADDQALKDDVMGEVTGNEAADETGDRSAGDEADATTRDDSTETDTAHTDPAPTTAAITGQAD